MLSDSTDKHKSVIPQFRHSDNDVLKLVSAFNQFLHPFKIFEDNDKLFCFSSGQPGSDKVANDLSTHIEAGEKAAEDFLKTRLVDRTLAFHAPMKKLKLATFQCMVTERMLTTTQKNTIRVKAERNLLGMLSQAIDILLEWLFQYLLGPISWALTTADGALIKTDKARLMHLLEQKCKPSENVEVADNTYVINGNAYFQAIVRLPETFEGSAYA